MMPHYSFAFHPFICQTASCLPVTVSAADTKQHCYLKMSSALSVNVSGLQGPLKDAHVEMPLLSVGELCYSWQAQPSAFHSSSQKATPRMQVSIYLCCY